MTSRTICIIAVAVVAGAFTGFAAEKNPAPAPAQKTGEGSGGVGALRELIVISTASRTLEAAAVKNRPVPAGLTYQWKKNGVIIPGATMNAYTIPSMTQSDVAIYSVVAMEPMKEKVFKTAAYSVSMLVSNLSGPGSGSLTVPVGDFSGSSGCCGVTFDKYKVYLPFDGPNVTSPSASFPNPLHKPKLTVDTLTGNSTTLNTCVFTRLSASPYTILSCNDDYPVPSGNKLSLCTATLATNKKYRATVCYLYNTLNGATTITWNYLYHD